MARMIDRLPDTTATSTASHCKYGSVVATKLMLADVPDTLAKATG